MGELNSLISETIKEGISTKCKYYLGLSLSTLTPLRCLDMCRALLHFVTTVTKQNMYKLGTKLSHCTATDESCH